MPRLRTALASLAAGCLVLPLGVGSAAAHGDEDDDVLDVEVLVTGLDSPRGLALDRKDDVWFAQAGRGGDGPCIPGPELGDVCLGGTGKVSVLREHGHRWKVKDVVTGLPSLAGASGINAIGPSDVALDRRGRALVTVGLAADPGVRTDPEGLGGSALAGDLATVQRLEGRRGTARTFADIGLHELTDNPEEEDLDSNPNSIAVGGGKRLVADAGANALLSIDRHGDVETVFVLPKEAAVPHPFAGAPGVPGVPGVPDTIEADAVPSTVVRGPDGAFYVGQLTGFPFTPGTATVWRVVPGQTPTVYADGFTNIIDLAFDEDGNLLVLEISHRGLLTQDLTGGLVRVDKRDTSRHTVLLTDPLVAPGGIVVDDDVAYISNHSTVAGDGQILRVELDD